MTAADTYIEAANAFRVQKMSMYGPDRLADGGLPSEWTRGGDRQAMANATDMQTEKLAKLLKRPPMCRSTI